MQWFYVETTFVETINDVPEMSSSFHTMVNKHTAIVTSNFIKPRHFSQMASLGQRKQLAHACHIQSKNDCVCARSTQRLLYWHAKFAQWK